MSIVVSIDPGTKVFGIAIWNCGELEEAYLGHTPKLRDVLLNLPNCDEVVLEKMQVYRGKSVASDLIDVAHVAGQIAGAMLYAYGSQITYYEPRVWKGAVDKAICHQRLRRILSLQELATIELPKSKKTQLDVMDAVGIGFFHVLHTKQRRRP
jgi:Holliday junction resolvasome RuvABC endonuclease subunit